MKQLPKRLMMAVFIILALPLALLSGFGRMRPIYLTGAHMVALAPGILGDYLRTAYYWMTLESCSLWCRISFGVILSNPVAVIEEGVYIGPYSVMGKVRIGRKTQIASLVQILSGARQHSRNERGEITGAEQGTFESIHIGAYSWIGAAAIVMADVGEKSTIGAASVVTRAVPPGVVAVGNPARVIEPPRASEPSH